MVEAPGLAAAPLPDDLDAEVGVAAVVAVGAVVAAEVAIEVGADVAAAVDDEVLEVMGADVAPVDPELTDVGELGADAQAARTIVATSRIVNSLRCFISCSFCWYKPFLA